MANLVYTVGTPLVVPAGKGFAASLTINDPVDCQGTILASNGPIQLNGCLTLQAPARSRWTNVPPLEPLPSAVGR